MTQKKTPHLVCGFFTFQCFVFFLIFAISCLSFSDFPLLLDFLKPKSGPSNEVIGKMAIYKIALLYFFVIFSVFWFRERIRDAFWGSEGFGIL